MKIRLQPLPWIALVALILLLEALQAGEALDYRRALLAAEPWRMLTGHLVHLSWRHALVNCIALLLVRWVMSASLTNGMHWLVLLAGALGISATLALWMPELASYRGLSGALHALFFAEAAAWFVQARSLSRWTAAVVLVAGAAKVLLEQPWSVEVFPLRDWPGAAVVPQAHLAGAVLGVALGSLLAARGQQDADH